MVALPGKPLLLLNHLSTFALIHFFPLQTRKYVGIGIRLESGDYATDVCWDALSAQYVLVACQSGAMALYDVQTGSEVRAGTSVAV